MDVTAAQDAFWQEYAKPACEQALAKIDGFFRANREHIAEKIGEQLAEFCRELRVRQQTDNREIAVICCALLYTALLRGEAVCRVDAYDSRFYDDDEPFTRQLDWNWLYAPLEEACDALEPIRRRYVGRVSPAFIDSVKRRVMFDYLPYAIMTVRQATKSEAFRSALQAVAKDQPFEVRVEEYKDLSEVVYYEDTRKKSAATVRRWLERKKKGEYFAADLKRLDLSGGEYCNVDLMYASFDEAELSRTLFAGAMLYGASMTKCRIGESDFSQSLLSGASFAGSCVSDADFSACRAGRRDVYEAGGQRVADILPGASFADAQIERTCFYAANLCGADFSAACIEESDFGESCLTEAMFDGAVLRRCDFRGAMLDGVDWSRTVLDDCRFE